MMTNDIWLEENGGQRAFLVEVKVQEDKGKKKQNPAKIFDCDSIFQVRQGDMLSFEPTEIDISL